eukprot:1156113-Pelagomonas_calceolata.AAC.5
MTAHRTAGALRDSLRTRASWHIALHDPPKLNVPLSLCSQDNTLPCMSLPKMTTSASSAPRAHPSRLPRMPSMMLGAKKIKVVHRKDWVEADVTEAGKVKERKVYIAVPACREIKR